MSVKVAIEAGDVNAECANSDDGEVPNSLLRNAILSRPWPKSYSPQFQRVEGREGRETPVRTTKRGRAAKPSLLVS